MTRYIFVGTYTQSWPANGHREEGVYRFVVEESGALRDQTAIPSGKNPSFVTVHPNKQFLYSVNELEEGGVSAFALDPAGAALTPLNGQPTNGSMPCYVSVDPSGRWLLSANYTGGSLAVHPIQADGRLGPLADHVQHVGTGPNPKRQEKAHAHSIAFAPGGKYIIACDLGMDKVLVYQLDGMTGKLTLHSEAAAEPGAGPRHFAFHPRKPQYLYVVNELASTVTLHAWDGQAGTLERLESWSALPEGYTGDTIAADIHFDPTGSYLYSSNRGHNSLAIYQVNEDDGRLTRVAIEPSGGDTPRNFAISPDGRFVYVANQLSNNLVCFARDVESGKLTPSGEVYSVPSPVCVQFLDL